MVFAVPRNMNFKTVPDDEEPEKLLKRCDAFRHRFPATKEAAPPPKHFGSSPASPGDDEELEKRKAAFKRCNAFRYRFLDKKELREAFKHEADADRDGLITETELDELVKYAQKTGYHF